VAIYAAAVACGSLVVDAGALYIAVQQAQQPTTTAPRQDLRYHLVPTPNWEGEYYAVADVWLLRDEDPYSDAR
jgi:hypothetical protein